LLYLSSVLRVFVFIGTAIAILGELKKNHHSFFSFSEAGSFPEELAFFYILICDPFIPARCSCPISIDPITFSD